MTVSTDIDPLSLPTRARVRIAQDAYFERYIMPILLRENDFAKQMYERAAGHPEASVELRYHLKKLAERKKPTEGAR